MVPGDSPPPPTKLEKGIAIDGRGLSAFCQSPIKSLERITSRLPDYLLTETMSGGRLQSLWALLVLMTKPTEILVRTAKFARCWIVGCRGMRIPQSSVWIPRSDQSVRLAKQPRAT